MCRTLSFFWAGVFFFCFCEMIHMFKPLHLLRADSSWSYFFRGFPPPTPPTSFSLLFLVFALICCPHPFQFLCGSVAFFPSWNHFDVRSCFRGLFSMWQRFFPRGLFLALPSRSWLQNSGCFSWSVSLFPSPGGNPLAAWFNSISETLFLRWGRCSPPLFAGIVRLKKQPPRGIHNFPRLFPSPGCIIRVQGILELLEEDVPPFLGPT